MKTITQLIRPELRAFKPYMPSPTLEELASKVNVSVEKFLKLNSGENLFSNQPYWLYPDPQANDLRQELAQYTGLPKDYIMAGNGSDELIDLVTRLFVTNQDEIINLPPTFSMYSFYARLNGAKVVNIPRTKTFDIDVGQIIKAISPNTKLIFICNPNNPTGTLIPKATILRLVKALPYLVVVDEAYFEYGSQTVAPDVKKYPNLIVLRSFSKWAGLAGLRLGYVIANPQIVKKLLAIKSPYSVNSLAQQAGIKALNNKAQLLTSLKSVIKGRQYLIEKLSQLPYIQVFPSQGAYVLFQLKTRSASNLQIYLRNQGIEVKVIDQSPLNNYVRINIVPPAVAKNLVDLIREFFQIDAIIFDMDGVLIDVSQSYRKTILQTANIFLKTRPGKQTITQKDIFALKNIPGFNNDWDVTYALVTSSLKPPTQKQRQNELYQQIKSTFQKLYLGGNINNETPLINKRTLSRIKQKGFKLGIATSRPRSEALFTLQQNKLTSFFPPQTLVAQEDTAKEKPNPQPLLETCQRLKAQNPLYIGDSINDILAAKAANMPCIFIDKNNDVNQAISTLL